MSRHTEAALMRRAARLLRSSTDPEWIEIAMQCDRIAAEAIATASSEQRKQRIGNLDEIHAEQGKPVVVVSRASIERDDFVPQETPLDRIDAQLRYERDTLGRGFIEGPIEMSDLEAVVADARLLQELRRVWRRQQ